MLIDQGHKKWIRITIVLFLIATATYIPYALFFPGGPRGNTWPGLLYGVIGSGLMLYAGLLSARKKVPTIRLGRAATWLKGHIWLGLLTVPLIAYHAAFSWGGWLEIALWIVFLTIIASGIFGLFMQATIPKLMTERVQMETIYEQIPHICSMIKFEADSIVASLCGALPEDADIPQAATVDKLNAEKFAVYHAQLDPPEGQEGEEKLRKKKEAKVDAKSAPLKQFYLSEVRPFLTVDFKSGSKLADASNAAGKFELLKRRLPPEMHEAVDQIADFCEERRQLALQTRLHHWLHTWLFLHVPLSFALLILGIAHAVMSSYY